MSNAFETASLIDIQPDLASCEAPFIIFGQKKKFSGKIRTIKCFRDNGLVKKIANSPSNGEVLVVDGEGSFFSALMGDLIATAAQKNGWAGAIINGVIRDSVAINEMDFSVKALGTNPKKSAKDGVGQVDVPVFFGNISFHPGDYVYSDEDGIVVSKESISY